MNTARPRLVVVQILVMALFITLFARLWYLQIASGEAYQAQAVDNAIEDVVVQPQRGLIVDAMGRSLAASRMSWVVTVDRTELGELAAARRRAVLHRLADVVDLSYRAVLVRTKLCGEPGAQPPPRCWNGSPYASVPVAEDVSQAVAISIQEQGEDFPGVSAEQQSVRSYPHPFGVNAAHLLGYLTPITADEYEHAQAEQDSSLNAASLVGRSGLERAYDRYLRGVPGSTGVAVDSMGRAVGAGSAFAATPGQTLVTSIDARVQAIVESELRYAIHTARQTVDTVTGRPYEASSGAAVVLDPRTGRVIASASYPTYDPDVWVGGISDADLQHLYAKKAGEPLLSRPTQAQLSPGSTWKPFMASGALSNGFRRDTELNCSSSFLVGNRAFTNFESGSHGYIGFDQALQLSCNTFFYQVGYELWQRAGGEDRGARADAVLADMAKAFGFGKPTGIDLPAEAGGRIADPRWKLAYWRSTKDYYCDVAKEPGSDYLHVFAREFCLEGYRFGAADAVNFVIGQGDTVVTPLQLAVGYSALANGGIVYAPRVAKAVVGPDGNLIRRIPPERLGRLPMSRRDLRYIDTALLGTAKVGTMAWKMGEFPLDEVRIRSKTGTAEVYGKQTTSWVATYDRNYVVVMMVEQGGTGSGTSGDSIRRIWEALYGIDGMDVNTAEAAIPGAKPPRALPTFHPDGSIEAPILRIDQRETRRRVEAGP
ncbi:MAG: penicillin-binding protein 2 [Nocardioidaceae bacterium]|nr:penicillin-binding protein 2 [Nocardioidaceae bacterium]